MKSFGNFPVKTKTEPIQQVYTKSQVLKMSFSRPIHGNNDGSDGNAFEQWALLKTLVHSDSQAIYGKLESYRADEVSSIQQQLYVQIS